MDLVSKLLTKYSHGLDDYAEKYSEPGYSKEIDDSPILFANWNGLKGSTMSAIEKQFNIEWSDEWYRCGECGGAVRTQGDGHGWTQNYYMFNDCEPVCKDCIDECEGLQEHIIGDLLDNSKNCNLLIDLDNHGFEEIECGYESGWHPGQTDNPEKILIAAQKQFPDKEFIFSDITVGQFDVSFCLYARDKKAA